MIRPLSLMATALLLSAGASTPSGPSASASLMATKGSTVTGSAQFTQKGGMVMVTGEVRGLAPNTEHGFHVHDKGDCSSGDGLSAGGHFNPHGKAHGAHEATEHHSGDLPSLKADASGTARFSFESSTMTVGSGITDVTGRGLIVHRDPDDYKTQPTGNAGPRLACAVISKS